MKTYHKPVIFIDFGETYFRGHTPLREKYAKKFRVTPQELFDAMHKNNWKNYAEGRISDKVYWENVRKALDIDEKMLNKFINDWLNYAKPIPGMPRLVTKLRKKYRVAVLSSINPTWVEALEKKYKISKMFHAHHYTFDHGVDKPSEKFFLRAAKAMNISPKDTIVIDNSKRFIAAIKKKTDAKTILFKNAADTEQKLRKMGVEI